MMRTSDREHQVIPAEIVKILSFFLFTLPYALVDILDRSVQRLLVQDSKKEEL